MGLRRQYVDFIEEVAGPLRGKSMLEIGNQRVRSTLSTLCTTGKAFWTASGVKHESIDLNGLDGAIALDLGSPIHRFNCAFDVVTDIGTSCYVKHKRQCWENLYSFTKVGGVQIHILPEVNSNWTALHFVCGMDFEEFARQHMCVVAANRILPGGEYGALRAAALVRVK